MQFASVLLVARAASLTNRGLALAHQQRNGHQCSHHVFVARAFTLCSHRASYPHRKYPGNLDDRVIAAYFVWKEDPDSSTITMAFGDIANPDDIAAADAVIQADPRASKAIRGGTRAWQAELVKQEPKRAALEPTRAALFALCSHMCVAHTCVALGSHNVHPQLREASGD